MRFMILIFLVSCFVFLPLSFVIDSDLTCSKIMRLFHGELPASEAKELGTYLDVPHAKIQEFRENNMGKANGMLIDVLNYWLEMDSEKSRSKLAEAVKNCGYGVLADKIRQKSSQLLEGSAGEFLVKHCYSCGLLMFYYCQ